MKKIFIAIILLVFVFSCKKETENIATYLNLVSGNYQITNIPGSMDPIVLLVSDQNGKPMSGVTVFFSVSDGSVSSSSIQTNEEGKASVIWTVRSNGSHVMSVTAFKNDKVTPLSGSPLKVTATSLSPAIIGSGQ